MDICRLFHKKGTKRKEQKFLLITHSFPQSPQVFPQGFSTGGVCCGYSVLVHIKRFARFRRISHFWAGRGFYHEHFFVQKLGLDNPSPEPRRTTAGTGRRSCKQRRRQPCCRDGAAGGKLLPPGTAKNFEKRVDFIAPRRYNAYLYGKRTEGGGIHAQYQVL